MKDLTIVDNYMKEEAIIQISSVTYPRIEIIDFETALKQFEKPEGMEKLEYDSLKKTKKAYEAWQRLKKRLSPKG